MPLPVGIGGMVHFDGVPHCNCRTDEAESGWKMSWRGDRGLWSTVYAALRGLDSKTGRWGAIEEFRAWVTQNDGHLNGSLIGMWPKFCFCLSLKKNLSSGRINFGMLSGAPGGPFLPPMFAFLTSERVRVSFLRAWFSYFYKSVLFFSLTPCFALCSHKPIFLGKIGLHRHVL